MSKPLRSTIALVAALLIALSVTGSSADDNFVNFESGHTRPLALSPANDLLFAVNTPDHRLDIFEVHPGGLLLVAEVPVGLDPVAVASRINSASGKVEAWVVNHLSDSVSVVEVDPGDVTLSHVRATLLVGDEPRDIVFGGSPVEKAFITTARRGQNLPPGLLPRFADKSVPRALVWVFNAENSGAGIGGTPEKVFELFGDTPRALAVSSDGSTVYAAVFHSGNGTTSLRDEFVTANGGSPPLPPDSPYFNDPEEPTQSLIVKRDPDTGEWNDEIGRDWSAEILFSLPDKDVFVINANPNPPVMAPGINTYSGVGTTLFNMAVRPGSGSVFVTNNEARNHVRFEPIEAGGVQGHVVDQRITVLAGIAVSAVPVNPHIDYSVATGPPEEIAESVSGLNDLVFSGDGLTLYAAALGSNQVAVFDATALEAGSSSRVLVDVGRGPSGVALDETRDRLYVMNMLDHSISIVTEASNPALREATSTVSLGYDPTPELVRSGRPFLYDARASSGHGDAACASCHTFGDADQLAWDLGDPYGPLTPDPNPFLLLPSQSPSPALPFHPLKGPMTTQSLRGLVDAGPMHWRGDRTAASDPGGDAMDADGSFKKFNAAFVDLLGRANPLTAEEMQAFTDFVLTIRYPPNPVADLGGELTKPQEIGLDLFLNDIDANLFVACNHCHALPLGTSGLSRFETNEDNIKVPHLRAVYQKVGMFGEERTRVFDDPSPLFQGDQIRGFGLFNDGTTAGILDFIRGFTIPRDNVPDMIDFVLSFDTGIPAMVGQQVTIGAAPSTEQKRRLELLLGRDGDRDCDLTFAGNIGGESRVGSVLVDGRVLLDDSALDPVGEDALEALAAVAGGEQTYTCRAPGTGETSTVDRDGDGIGGAEELREGTDPMDAASVPYACIGGGQEAIDDIKFSVSKNNLPFGNESISMKAAWVPSNPDAIDPSITGVTLLLRDAAGSILHHQRVLATGWTASSDGRKWKYTGAKGAMVRKIAVARTGEDGISVAFKGGGDFAIDSPDFRLELVFGGNDEAAMGLCATRTFGEVGGPSCIVGKKVKCE